jgi:hypothetical protein
MRFWTAALIIFSGNTAFAKLIPSADNKMLEKDVISMTVGWIKDKGEKFDLKVVLHNENNEKGIIVFLKDMGCKRGDADGSLKHTFFNTGERTIDFRPKQTKSFNMVCDLPGKTKGHYKISIAKVYDNPSLDGKTAGKIIAHDLTWTQDDRD